MINPPGVHTTLCLIVDVKYAAADLRHVGANALGDLVRPSREQELCQLWYITGNVLNPSGLYGTYVFMPELRLIIQLYGFGEMRT